jgi:lysyl endopeptidase
LISHRPAPALVAALTMLCFAFAHAANAAVPVHVVKTDLKPLIRAAYTSPVQFAVLVPHTAAVGTAGTWSVRGDRATWTYAVQVPTAVSMSFHATQVSLPASASLIVRGAKTTTSYLSRDVHRGELWSRVHPGDALQITLTVAAADRSKVAMTIVSLQAGYRSLGASVEDHPYYRQLKALERPAQASDNASCVTNYQCQVTTSNTPAGAATVALLVENQWECTGSLINDVPQDNTPYVLTARHCETGQLGGGNPGAAAAVTVYWDAISPCGATLGSIYDANIQTQSGAQTIVEQQDAWLIRLASSPVVSDAQLAGFDATGGAVQGGYTIHHAKGGDKQFVEWYGQAYAAQESDVNGTKYVSNFLETVNQLGNYGPGASGGGLFDQNDHLVGSLTGGPAGGNDSSGYYACPASPPSAPNGSNAVAYFTSLSAVWNSTADTTSSTGTKTLQSVLDPANTGVAVVASIPAESIAFSATPTVVSDGAQAALDWNAPNATQCTAGGGVSGDGWTGTLNPSGSQSITESISSEVTYTLSCAYAGGRAATATATVDWVGPTPLVTLTGPHAVWTTRPAVLSWSSNVTPCSLSGGGLSLSNLAGVGTASTTQATATDITYAVTCGPANDQGSSSSTVMYVTPNLILEPTGTDRILGQTFYLHWLTYADVCTPSGGAAGDGWANNSFNAANNPASEFAPNVTAVGTYTYTLTCSSGPISVTQSVTVTFEQNARYTTSSLGTLSVTYTDSPADYVTLNWDSNISSCTINTSPNIPFSLNDPLMIAYQAQGSALLNPPAPGTYTVSVTCAIPGNTPTQVTSTPQTLTVLPPPAPVETLTITPASVIQGQSFTASWSSTNASYCAASGGVPQSGWDTNGAFADPANGTFTYTPGGPGQTGQFTFTLSCESIASGVPSTSTQATLTVEALTDNLTISPASVTMNQPFTLSWASSGAGGCTASGGGANGSPWSGSLATAGTATQTATVSGSFTYTLTCTANSFTAQAQAIVTVSAASGGGGSAGHGGGGLSLLELGSLAALIGLRRRLGQQERTPRS